MNARQRQQAAMQELMSKSLSQIQEETAYAWAYRAWAARQIAYQRDDNVVAYADALCVTVEYEHEAVEHGALAGDEVLARVRAIIAGEV